jgi:antirestriction protein ArdC
MPKKSSFLSLAPRFWLLSPEPLDEHAANIAHWLEGLRGDKRFIFQAASHAQKAVDYLQGQQPKSNEIAE